MRDSQVFSDTTSKISSSTRIRSRRKVRAFSIGRSRSNYPYGLRLPDGDPGALIDPG
jgi:hypothetical protein